MNIVAIIGNVSTAPHLGYTSTGRAVCTFDVAVTRPEATNHYTFKVVAWERQAEVAHQYMYPGRRIGIEGRLHVNPDGETEIIAHRLQLLGATQCADKEAVASTNGED